METKFDPNTKVKQGDLGSAPDGKQPNQEATNVNFSKNAPRKGESETALKDINYPTKSGSEHVQNPLLQKADKGSY
mgnify:CR=1 FL=1